MKINANSVSEKNELDSQLRNDSGKISQLIDLMNDQSFTPVLAMEELIKAFDAVFSPSEIDFLLKMGGGIQSLKEIEIKVNLPKKKFTKIFDSLLHKGTIIELHTDDELKYHIMSIIPGWCELYMHQGLETPERKLFAERLGEFYRGLEEYGDREFLNNMLRDLGPNHAIFSMVPSKKVIKVDKTISPEVSKVFPTKTVVEIFEKLDENDAIALSHCFCRHQKYLVGDPCRLHMAPQSCIYLGPHAEHLIKYGFSTKITKAKAIELIKEFRDKGAVHLVGKTAPLKNLKDKFEIDNICSCCWDCCGLFGNYHRGNMPFLLKAFHIAELADKEACSGCETCINYCPLQALSLNNEGVIEIDHERCCGCGLCNYHCPNDAIQMVPLEREVFLPMQDRNECKIPTANLKKQDDKAEIATQEDDDEFTASMEVVFEVIDELYEKFQEEKAKEVFKGWNKTMLFQFTDINEYWHMKVIDGIAQPKEEGFVENADIIYIMKTGVFVKVMRGEMSAVSALRRKLIKVKASVKDLIKLMKLS